MKTRSRKPCRRTLTATAAVVSVLLTACGSEGDTADAEASSWRDINVCDLLKPQEVSDYLGRSKTREQVKQNDLDRPTCVWKSGDPPPYTVKVNLWVPPDPQSHIANSERVINVANSKGYVASESNRGDCMMDVEKKPAWLHIETDPPIPTDDGTPRACDRAAKLVEKALSRMGK